MGALPDRLQAAGNTHHTQLTYKDSADASTHVIWPEFVEEQSNQAQPQGREAQVCVVHPPLVVAEGQQRHAYHAENEAHMLGEVPMEFVLGCQLLLTAGLLLCRCCI